MLFNSFVFLLVFLPIVVLVFFKIGRYSEFYAAAWMVVASLFFYGWWDYRYLLLLLISIIFNYISGCIIIKFNMHKKHILIIAIIFNLLLLFYYKYAVFFADIFNAINMVSVDISDTLLPIGISFFTFTQIAFLVDTYQGKVKEYRFVHYLLFVTYFPHLIAGPVLHHKEMMPQFSNNSNYRLSSTNFSVGISIFIIGLAKKVLIADNIAPYANDLFSNVQTPSFLIAWGGVLAYSFQIYFDFSGYSDMAIGLSRLFGVRLPLNFNSPYKSVSIVEFWRRWHMTLSRFLRDYLYIPLGGNRYGSVRRHANLFITMLLGGLWHGAGWTFIIWGGLHGIYLIINHAWIATTKRSAFFQKVNGLEFLSTIITFMAICFSWVFFRAVDINSANDIIKGMIGSYGMSIPNAIAAHLGSIEPLLEQAGVGIFLGGGARFIETWCWVIISACLVFLFPNTQQIMRHFDPALDFKPDDYQQSMLTKKLHWKPSCQWATLIGFMALLSLLSLNSPSDFLYFQF